jgi:hypothetical protein
MLSVRSSSSSSASLRETTEGETHCVNKHDDNDIDMTSDTSEFQFKSDLPDDPTYAELSPISMIPIEVLQLIFSHFSHKPDLVSLLRVCKKWANLIVEMLWFRPALTSYRAMKGIQKVMEFDRSSTVWDYRRFIRRLNMSFVYEYVTDDFLLLFKGCPNLERLTLVNCSQLSSKAICMVLEGCTKLQSIDMTGLEDINDSVLKALGYNSTRLQGLYAPCCPQVTREGIAHIYNNCPMLKRMKITENDTIQDEDMIKFVENCKSLIEVDVHACTQLTNESFRRVFMDLEQLREFRTSHNGNITDLLFRHLPDRIQLDRLRVIDLTSCFNITDESVERIVQAAPRLRNVCLSKCANITDNSLRSLARLGKNLHYIHLGHCSNITDLGIVLLSRSCHRLQYIDLACCSELTNTALVELAHLPRLKRIGLVKCTNITDLGMSTFVMRRGHDDTLERVHLSYCTNLGLAPIHALLQSCPRLTHLSLTGIRAFLRGDITQYCRDPPTDFNEHQRNLFCVFSGQGVKRLRDHLTRLYLQNPEAFRDTVMENQADPEQAWGAFALRFPPPNGQAVPQMLEMERFRRAVQAQMIDGAENAEGEREGQQPQLPIQNFLPLGPPQMNPPFIQPGWRPGQDFGNRFNPVGNNNNNNNNNNRLIPILRVPDGAPMAQILRNQQAVPIVAPVQQPLNDDIEVEEIDSD